MASFRSDAYCDTSPDRSSYVSPFLGAWNTLRIRFSNDIGFDGGIGFGVDIYAVLLTMPRAGIELGHVLGVVVVVLV